MLLHIIACFAKAGQKILSLIAGCITLILFVYSGYVLYDTFYLNSTAFTSWDLMQYKPGPRTEETAGFYALIEINPDVVGWLEIEGTHINYPVLHGTDDLQYAYMDVYGHADMNGSIYLSSSNQASFQEDYVMIYGHNMANGGMFGDIPKFLEPSFLKQHRKGVLTTVDRVYALEFFACVQTNAYESMVYTVGCRDTESMHALENYIQEHASSCEMSHTADAPLVALSTCSSASTYGRTVLFARLTAQDTEQVSAEIKEKPIEHEPEVVRKAVGHTVNRKRFAFVNLLCVLCNLYFLIPCGRLKSKYSSWPGAAAETAARRRFKRTIAGIIAETIVLTASVVFFISTENIRDPLTLVDCFTPVMLGFMILSLVIDLFAFPASIHRNQDMVRS